MLAGFSNAYYDSEFPFEKLIQTNYIVDVIKELKNELPEFERYNFVFFFGDIGMEPRMKDSYLPHKILIQWSDQLGMEPSEEVMKSFDVVFKTHLRHKSQKYKNLFSYPLGIPCLIKEQPLVPMNNRKIPVFYSGNLNDCRIPFYSVFTKTQMNGKLLISRLLSFIMKRFSERGKYRAWNLRIKSLIFKVGVTKFDYLWEGSIIRFTKGYQAGFSPNEYAEILSQSKIVLSPCGFFNTECFRFYEALRQGCIVITEKLPKTDYYDPNYYIEVENWSNVETIVNQLLADPVKMEQMSLRAREYYEEVLSPKGVAKYISNKLNCKK